MKVTAAYGEVDLTPRGARALCGFAARPQPATRVAAPILGRLTLLRVGRSGVLIVACDVLGFTLTDSQRIERALAQTSGLPAANILLSCTHNHSGPMSMPLGAVGQFDPRYVEFVARQLAQTAQRLRHNLVPVTRARFGAASIADYGELRCAKEEPGRNHWPGVLSVLQLERETASPITLWHAGMHPYLLGPQSRVMHPDFPGPTCALIARITAGHALFLAGAGADVSPRPAFGTSLRKLQKFAQALTTQVQSALAVAQEVPLTPLRVRFMTPLIHYGFMPAVHRPMGPVYTAKARPQRTEKVPNFAADIWERNRRTWLDRLARGELPARDRLPLRVVRLGPVLLLAIPAEIFHDTGVDLQRTLSKMNMHAFPLAHTGGNIGYLPRPFAYRRRTYEANSAYQWYGTAGAVARGEERKVRSCLLRAARSPRP